MCEDDDGFSIFMDSNNKSHVGFRHKEVLISFLISFSYKKLFSAVAFVTGKVKCSKHGIITSEKK